MPEHDERLQQYLSQIEAGVPKDKVLSSLKEGEQELAALIKLADAMRTISHPMPSPAYARATKQKILEAVPQARPAPRSNNGFQLGWLFFPSLTGAVAVFLVLFITLATLGVWLSGPASADVGMIQDVDGLVELAEVGANVEWTPLTGGEVVRSGQQIHTSPGSAVTVVFSDGTQARLDAETTIVLKEVDGTWGGDLQVEIEQTIGKTSHKVIPLRSSSGFYIVRTPAGFASVHGTSFTVDVQANGVARVIVDSGEVAVSNAANQVLLPAGQATLLQVGKAPQESGNFFSIVDFVVKIEGMQWAVSGQGFRIADQTYISGAPSIGQALQIEGRILPSGEWVADSIAPVDSSARSTFAGIIEAITTGRLQVGGRNIAISDFTKLTPELSVGDSVEVTYLALSDESWLATDVEKLEVTAAEPEETQEETVTAQSNETTQQKPLSESEIESCKSSDPTPEVLILADYLSAAPEDIQGLFCSGLTLDEIALVYNLSDETGWPVQEIANLSLLGNMGWAEINAYLLEYQSPALSFGSPICIGIAFEPKAQQLAKKYDVTYEEIIELACAGFSFGSIDLAYNLAQNESNLVGYTPLEILNLKYSGRDWAEIRKSLKEAKIPPGQDKDKKIPPGQDKDKNTPPGQDKDKNTPPGQEVKEEKTPQGIEDKEK